MDDPWVEENGDRYLRGVLLLRRRIATVVALRRILLLMMLRMVAAWRGAIWRLLLVVLLAVRVVGGWVITLPSSAGVV